jgi:hypothetical protein
LLFLPLKQTTYLFYSGGQFVARFFPKNTRIVFTRGKKWKKKEKRREKKQKFESFFKLIFQLILISTQ